MSLVNLKVYPAAQRSDGSDSSVCPDLTSASDNYVSDTASDSNNGEGMGANNERAMAKMNKFIARQVAKPGIYPGYLFLSSTKSNYSQCFVFQPLVNWPCLFLLTPAIKRWGYEENMSQGAQVQMGQPEFLLEELETKEVLVGE